MDPFGVPDLDAKRREYSFMEHIFGMFSENGYFWIKKPEYIMFREKSEDKFEPDLQFESMESGKCFWMDCIFKTDYDKDGDLGIYPEEDFFKRIEDYESLGEPVFVSVAVGGTPNDPYDFIFGHISDFAFHTLTSQRCRELEIPLKLSVIEEKMNL